ncbi:MAG TPA: PIN domain-containing protein [Rhizomicrobium sp.]|jgi:predicted nucleic acid-binding protein|nr:PIN domain-containing protein [Rhizomicrobium sp.]
MNVEAVLDTNVLVYSVSRLESDREKRDRAQELMRKPFGVSGQILQEFYVNVTRKIQKPLPPELALEWVEQLEQQPCISVDATLVKNGIVTSERYRISYWDGAILAAAEALGAETLYTEDLNHGQLYGSVRVLNPFRPD